MQKPPQSPARPSIESLAYRAMWQRQEQCELHARGWQIRVATLAKARINGNVLSSAAASTPARSRTPGEPEEDENDLEYQEWSMPERPGQIAAKCPLP